MQALFIIHIYCFWYLSHVKHFSPSLLCNASIFSKEPHFPCDVSLLFSGLSQCLTAIKYIDHCVKQVLVICNYISSKTFECCSNGGCWQITFWTFIFIFLSIFLSTAYFQDILAVRLDEEYVRLLKCAPLRALG